ncbi:MAG: hydrogenase expression/formation protein HypE [Marinifilaceae bacterium]
MEHILLNHGSGGKLSSKLISELFVRYFDNRYLAELSDSAQLKVKNSKLAFTTDSYVVDPIFFPGGNIGKLAICGTINDLCVSGAHPMYLSVGFILEEGFPMKDLEEIVRSMAVESHKAGVKIVCGDTKVVNKGKCDKIFINTSGIGVIDDKHSEIGTGKKIQPGDKIIVNGYLGDHGIAILGAREALNFHTQIDSDCASLNSMISEILKVSDQIRFMRDITRGGLATVLCEIAGGKDFGIEIDEVKIPLREEVKGVCELLGYDPLYIANEGKVVIVAGSEETAKILTTLRQHPLGVHSNIIGEITETQSGKVALRTEIGGRRFIDKLTGDQLPRIC